jgi:hypothetical protein
MQKALDLKANITSMPYGIKSQTEIAVTNRTTFSEENAPESGSL